MIKKYDLVFIGSSFASTFFLKKILETASEDLKIAVLERGIRFPHSERLSAKQNYKPNPPNVKGFNSTYLTKSKKTWVFDPNFGGSSNCWTGCTPRFMPNDFMMYSRYKRGMDWPISYDDIEQYYMEAEKIMAISGPDITPFPRKSGYPLPPHDLSTVDKILQKEYRDLYISQPTARASRRVGKRGRCCSSSVCGVCPVDSKFTIENSLATIFEDRRIDLFLESQVYELGLNNDHVTSLICRHNGSDLKIEGETFVLGANAIFNAHILLNSGDDSKMLGKGISEQVGTFVRVYLEGLDNVGGSSIISANGFMMYDGEHRSDKAGCLIESFNTPFIRNEKGKWRQLALFKFVYEDIPSDKNYVDRSDDVFKPSIIYEGHSEYTESGLADLKNDIEKYFSVLPIERIELDGYNQPTEFHICSTARMSQDASSGVVDKNLLHHKYRNLYVLGSSSFPSITPANPTLTIAALSLMAGDHYADKSEPNVS